MLLVLCLCKICTIVWDACLEAAGIELCRWWGSIDLDRERNTRVRNVQLLSINVVKQNTWFSGTLVKTTWKEYREMDYRSWLCFINHGKEKYRSFQKETETVIRGWGRSNRHFTSKCPKFCMMMMMALLLIIIIIIIIIIMADQLECKLMLIWLVGSTAVVVPSQRILKASVWPLLNVKWK